MNILGKTLCAAAVCFMSINTHAAAYSQDELNLELYNAVLKNDYERAEHFLAAGADVNARHSFVGESPIFAAIEENNFEIVRLLLDNDADPNVQSSIRQTPLCCAIGEVNKISDKKIIQSIKILVKLLKAGAISNKKNASLRTSLHLFASCGGHISSQNKVFVILSLLEAGADKYFKDSKGLTASDISRKYGFVGLADIIAYWPGENLQERVLYSMLKRCFSPDEQEKEAVIQDLKDLFYRCPHYIPFFQRFGVLDIAQA